MDDVQKDLTINIVNTKALIEQNEIKSEAKIKNIEKTMQTLSLRMDNIENTSETSVLPPPPRNSPVPMALTNHHNEEAIEAISTQLDDLHITDPTEHEGVDSEQPVDVTKTKNLPEKAHEYLKHSSKDREPEPVITTF